MKKLSRLLALTLVLCLPVASAMAKENLTNRPMADGVVSAVSFTDVAAPCSGTLTSFDLQSGDAVAVDQPLMSYVTTDLYATEDGVLSALFAAPGDDASAVTARFGGVLGIEPTQNKRLSATTSGASNDAVYKHIHLGETLYFESSGADKEEGTGRVIAVSGSSYQVDILTGSFDLAASMNLYRTDNYDAKKCVGKGVVVRRDDVLLPGQGRVVAVYAAEGDTVHRGQKLMSLLAADASPEMVSPEVRAPQAGVIATVTVQPGQQVWRGQTLLRLYPTDALEVAADVDEMDLGDLRVGDSIPVTLDVNPDAVISGTVTEISFLGVTKLNAAYFTVHVSIPAGSARLGTSASIYLPEKE